MDFLRKTNPWRSKEDVEHEKLVEHMEETADREATMSAIADWARRMGEAQAQRDGIATSGQTPETTPIEPIKK